MNRTKQLLNNFVSDECGADLIEYALVAAVLALSALAAQASLIVKVQGEFNMITNHFS
jgi:Flp pilus assembly pilin Flp